MDLAARPIKYVGFYSYPILLPQITMFSKPCSAATMCPLQKIEDSLYSMIKQVFLLSKYSTFPIQFKRIHE